MTLLLWLVADKCVDCGDCIGCDDDGAAGNSELLDDCIVREEVGLTILSSGSETSIPEYVSARCMDSLSMEGGGILTPFLLPSSPPFLRNFLLARLDRFGADPPRLIVLSERLPTLWLLLLFPRNHISLLCLKETRPSDVSALDREASRVAL